MTPEQIQKIANYQAMMFSQLRSSLIQDVLNSRSENYIGRRYTVDNLFSMLENPSLSTNQKQLRQMSMWLYLTSSHYRRLVNYYATLPTFNYIVVPNKATTKKVNEKRYKQDYYDTITDMERYEFQDELPKMMISAITLGAFCGIVFESEDSFYVKQAPIDYVRVTSILDGCYRFSVDLAYFNGNNAYLLDAYGDEIASAYRKYSSGGNQYRWYEPEKQICIKYDSDPTIILPFFAGMYKEVLDLEDYRVLAKAKTEIENYKVLVMRQDVDDDGIPKMEYEMAKKYYDQAAGNLPSGIGLILSPFSVSDFSFEASKVGDTTDVNDARDSLWEAAGTSPLIFGSTKATSSQSLILSTKPDEQISFILLHQIERNFNLLQKLKNKKTSFKVKFLEQSIFSKKEFTDMWAKAAQYGVTGAKSYYAASLGLTPSDIVNMAYLEDDILGMTTEMFNKPLVSSNTRSYYQSTTTSSSGRGGWHWGDGQRNREEREAETTESGGRPVSETVSDKTEANQNSQ